MSNQTSAFEGGPDRGRGNTHSATDLCPVMAVIAQLLCLLNIPAWALVFALILGGYSANPESVEYGGHGDAVVISDGLQAPSFGAQLGSFVNRPLPGAHEMMMLVITRAHDLKVIDAVVEAIPVFMVNVLGAQKFSPKALLNDVAVLKHLLAFSVDHHSDVTVVRKSFEASNIASLVWSSHDV